MATARVRAARASYEAWIAARAAAMAEQAWIADDTDEAAWAFLSASTAADGARRRANAMWKAAAHEADNVG